MHYFALLSHNKVYGCTQLIEETDQNRVKWRLDIGNPNYDEALFLLLCMSNKDVSSDLLLDSAACSKN